MIASTKSEPIDWLVWRLKRLATEWELAALSLNINPDGLQVTSSSWMSTIDGGPPVFAQHCFDSPQRHHAFEKRRRLVAAWAEAHSDKVTYHNSRRVAITPFVRWARDNNLPDMPPEFIALADIALSAPSPSVQSPSEGCAKTLEPPANAAKGGRPPVRDKKAK